MRKQGSYYHTTTNLLVKTKNTCIVFFALLVAMLFSTSNSYAHAMVRNDLPTSPPVNNFFNNHSKKAKFLTSLSGQVSNCQIMLNWDTRTEIGNDRFEIQRSSDGQRFFTIGRVSGAGNSITPQHYQYSDENIFKSDYYYRLRLVDFNGDFLYSDIIQMETSCQKDRISVYNIFSNPNARNWMNMKVFTEQDMEEAVLVIKDKASRQLQQIAVEIKPGLNTIPFNTEDLIAGTYQVEIISDHRPVVSTSFTK